MGNKDLVDIPTWYLDYDSDGYGSETQSTQDCDQPSGYVSDNSDCDDADNTISPAGTEIEDDSIDQDCSGADSIGRDPDESGSGAEETGEEAGGTSGGGCGCDIFGARQSNSIHSIFLILLLAMPVGVIRFYKSSIKKNFLFLLCLLLTSLLTVQVRAAAPFLKEQSYHFGNFYISGVDGASFLFTKYSSEYFRIVAYQTYDGKVNNEVHILTVVDNSSILWSDVSSVDITVDTPSTGAITTTSLPIPSGTLGHVDILENDHTTLPDASQTIILNYTLSFVDGSTMYLESELMLEVK